MRLIFITIFLFSAAISQAQLLSDSLRIENHYRTFHFRKPGASRPSSLIFVLHGSGGNGSDFRKNALQLEALSDKEKMLLVYPDGYKHFWNECRKAAQTPPNLENINEEAFFTALISYFQKNYGIDDRRVFAIGFSGGGHMAYKLAFTMPEKIRAITAIVASLPDSTNFDCVAKKVAKPVMIINGTLDPLNKWEGGDIVLGNNITMGRMQSTDNSFHYWANLAGYTGAPRTEMLPDNDPADGKTIE
jgi:polyhydroxybutyrate depolymerase